MTFGVGNGVDVAMVQTVGIGQSYRQLTTSTAHNVSVTNRHRPGKVFVQVPPPSTVLKTRQKGQKQQKGRRSCEGVGVYEQAVRFGGLVDTTRLLRL